MSSGTMADPIKPVAPVRNTRMLFCPFAPFEWRIRHRRMLTNRYEPAKTELVSVSIDYRRLSPVARFFRVMPTKRKQASVRKPRSDAQRNRESILEVAKKAFTRPAANKSGDIRKDLDPIDLLRALIGVANVATSPDLQQSARRLVDILITGSRPAK